MNQPTDSDSIYRAPESNTATAPVGDQMAAFVGAKYDSYYARRFANFERGSSASWNWPAFFAAAFWLLYRKMWAMAALYWFVLPMVLAIIAAIISATQSNTMTALVVFNSIYYGAYIIVAFILMPMYANRLYFRHANKHIAKANIRFPQPEQRALELARLGGTSSIVIVVIPVVLIALIGILAAISIPAYQDYTIRAQVSEGLNLSTGAKYAVAQYYVDVGEFPENNAEAGLELPRNISGSYVASVQVEYGDVVITYGNDAHSILAGDTLVLTPITDGGNVSWTCYSDDLADKHLPAACR